MFFRSKSSQGAIGHSPDLTALQSIEPVIKGFISPNSIYLYVLKATSNNSFTVNLVDLKKRRHISDYKMIGKDLEDVQGCALNNGIVLSGIQRNKFVSFVALENKGKLNKLWDEPVDLKLFGKNPSTNKPTIKTKYTIPPKSYSLNQRLWLSNGKLLGVESRGQKIFEVDLKTGGLKSFHRLSLGGMNRTVLKLEYSRVMNHIVVIYDHEIEFIDTCDHRL